MILFGMFLKENRSETHMTKVQILAFLLCDLCKSLNPLISVCSVGSADLLDPYTLKQKSGCIVCFRLIENVLIYISHAKD